MNRTSCVVLLAAVAIAGCGAPPQGGGTGGTGGGAGSGGNACPRSSVNGNQVVFIGDSFLAAPTSNIAPELEALWQAAGSPGYSATPRYHQLVATNMAQIAGQYDAARAANRDIKVVIANGGGNDVLILNRSCLTQAPPANTSCTTTISNALQSADQLMTKMTADGVQHVVYFFYPHEPTSGIFQGNAPAINTTLDYAEPRARAVCDRHPNCTFVSLREATGDAIGSGYTERGLINPADVHPSPAGSKFFAKAIWDVMKSRCILTP